MYTSEFEFQLNFFRKTVNMKLLDFEKVSDIKYILVFHVRVLWGI